MKRVIALLAFGACITTAGAQSLEEIFQMSENSYSYSTARSAAMGGAFGSLGADPASMVINPAGMGMYRSSEISVSPALKISSITSKTFAPNGVLSDKTNRTSGMLNNASGIYNIMDRGKNHILRGLTIGVGYNQARNEDNRLFSRAPLSGKSIADYFASQIYGIDPKFITSTNENPYLPYQRVPSTDKWGGILAYNTGLIFPELNEWNEYAYYTDMYNEQGELVGSLLQGDKVLPSYMRKMSGTTGEYNFSIGGNIKDIFFFGMTLGAKNFNSRSHVYYNETTPPGNKGDLAELRYHQWLNKSGNAFNFKAGITVQPVNGLRIGVAVHTPNLYRISEEYSAMMDNYYYTANGVDQFRSETAFALNDYKVHTPTHLIGAISYNFFNRAILSFDYERIWYNKMKVTGLTYIPGQMTFNDQIEATYKPSDNYRAGIEITPVSGFFLRGGYAFYGGALKNGGNKTGSITNISAGAGFRTNRFYVDLAYIHMKRDLESFRYYSATYGQETVQSESLVVPTQKENNLILTVGIKF